MCEMLDAQRTTNDRARSTLHAPRPSLASHNFFLNSFLCGNCASSVEPKIYYSSSADGSLWMTSAHEHPADSSAASTITGSPSFSIQFWISERFSGTVSARAHTHTLTELPDHRTARSISIFGWRARSQLNWDLWTCVARATKTIQINRIRNCAHSIWIKMHSLISKWTLDARFHWTKETNTTYTKDERANN